MSSEPAQTALFDDGGPPVKEKKTELKFTSHQEKCIKWYIQEHGYKLQLSCYPVVYMKDAADKTVKVNITDIKNEYRGHKTSEARERSRQRKQAKK